MYAMIEKVMPWGPGFFGVLVFAPMFAAALDASGLALPGGVPNLGATLLAGFCWGLYAKTRGRWV